MKIGNVRLVSKAFTPDKFRLWLLVLLVGLTSLASYWILEIVRSRDIGESKPVRTRPDYYVDHFNFIKMLPSGQSKYRIVGERLDHYPDDDHADVSLPVMTNLDPGQPPLTIRSERGMIKNIANQTENEVHLYEKVVVIRPKTAETDHLQLNTDYLLAYPDKSIIETNLPVEIHAGDTVTTGVGMTANNVTQEMHILSQVHSVVPPRLEQNKTPSK